MTGTQNHEGIAGTAAAVDYLASLASETISNTHPVQLWYLPSTPSRHTKIITRTAPGRTGRDRWSARVGDNSQPALSDRVPTVSFTWPGHDPQHLSEQLAAHGIYVWAGNHYALPFTEAAGLEPAGTLRVGLLHYKYDR